MPGFTTRSLALSILFLTASNAFGAKILLIGGEDTSNTSMMASVLEAQGNTVTTGPAFTAFAGGGLSAYNAVFFLPNGPDWRRIDMPESGQQDLVDFVRGGGGLVTSEPVGDLLAAAYGKPLLQTLGQAVPIYPSTVMTGNSPVILGQLTNDPVMNDQLPSQLVLNTQRSQDYDTETFYTPKSGATAFFDTNQWSATFGGGGIGAGAVGWDFGSGRVLSLSTFSDTPLLADPTYERLIGNSVRWAAHEAAVGPISTTVPDPGSTTVPEPGSLLVLAAAGVAFAATARTRRRACEGRGIGRVAVPFIPRD
jgi:hypothetical protein